MPPYNEQQPIDLRIYIGILLLRWQVVAICFLYALLGGVLYINLAPKLYLTKCKIMIFRDPNLEVSSASSPWRSFSVHAYLLEGEALRKQAVRRLLPEWGDAMGGERGCCSA